MESLLAWISSRDAGLCPLWDNCHVLAAQMCKQPTLVGHLWALGDQGEVRPAVIKDTGSHPPPQELAYNSLSNATIFFTFSGNGLKSSMLDDTQLTLNSPSGYLEW